MARSLPTLMALLVPLALAGCGTSNLRNESHILDHPVQVTMANTEVVVETDGRGSVREPVRGWNSIVVEHARRGHSRIIVEGNRADVNSVSRLLVSAGLPATSLDPRILSRHRDGVERQVRVSFAAYSALLPECGDFSSDRNALFSNHYNRSSSNLGCNTRRNIAIMLSDPGDLVSSRNRQAFGDATSTRTVGRVTDFGTYERPAPLPLTGGSSQGGR